MFKFANLESNHHLFNFKDIIPWVMEFIQVFLVMEEKRYHIVLQIYGVNNHLDLHKALGVEVWDMLILSSISQLYKLILDPCGCLIEVKCSCRFEDHNQEKISIYRF